MSSEFADLARYRQILKGFCKAHVSSVLTFRFKAGVSFKMNLEEHEVDSKLRHLTSTSTCIESLLDCPDEFLPKKKRLLEDNLGSDFAIQAIKRSPQK